MPKDKINIEHKDDVLTISGSNQVETKDEDKDKRWHRVERRYGSFSRSIQLPKGLPDDAISAKSTDGILTITVTKPEPPAKKSSTIKIQ